MRSGVRFWLGGLLLASLAWSPQARAHDDDVHHDVKAPGVEVTHTKDGGVRVRAPFVEVETDGRDGTMVDAPFHHSDTRELPPPAADRHTKMSSYSHPDGLYTLALPAGWRAFPNNGSYVAGFRDPSNQAAVKVVVLSDREYKLSDLKAVSDQACKKCEETLRDLKVLASADSTLGGQPAVRTDVTFTQGGVPARGAMFVSIQRGRVVTMSIRGDVKDFDSWAPTLYAIVASYRGAGR